MNEKKLVNETKYWMEKNNEWKNSEWIELVNEKKLLNEQNWSKETN